MNPPRPTRAQLLAEIRRLREEVARLERGAAAPARRAPPVNRSTSAESPQLSAILEQTSEGIALADLDGTLRYVNAAFAAMHGFRPDELVGQHLSIFHTPDQRPAVEQANRCMLQTGEFHGEVWHARRDGSVFPALMHNTLLHDADGSPIGMIGTMTDISELTHARAGLEQARAEIEQRVRDRTAELAQANARLRAEIAEREQAERALHRQALVFDTIHDAVLITDTNGRITDWNPGAERLFGYRREEISGQSPEVLNRTSDAAAITAAIKDGLRRDGRWSGEITFVRQDGREGVCEAVVVPLRDEHGHHVGAVSVNRDITDRKRAEEALRLSEERYRTLFENIPIGVYRTTPDGRVLDANPALVRMLGFASFEELARRNLETDSFDPDYPRTEFKRRIEQAGTITIEDVAWRRRDGRRILVRENARAIRNPAGRVTCYEGTVEDVTARRQAEEQLRASEQRFRTVVSASKDAMVAIDRDGCVTIFNPAAEAMFGRTRAEMLNQPLDCLIPEELRAAHRQNVRDYFATGRPNGAIGTTLELTGVRRDGTLSPVELSLSAGQRDGEPFVLAVIRDITQRRAAEEALRQSEAKYRTLVEQIPAIVYTAALDALSSSTYVSPQVEQYLGYPYAEYIADTDAWSKHIHPEDRGRVLAEVTRCQAEGRPLNIEYRMLARDGSAVWFRDEARVVRDEHGRPLCLQGVMLDITERRRIEEERARLAEHLHEAQKVQAVGQVAIGIAHDFGSLLAATRHSLHRLRALLPPSAEAAECLNAADQAVEEADSRTRSLLLFSRRLPTEHVPVPVRQLLTECGTLLRHVLPDSVQLRFEVPATLECCVEGDPAQLRQVLLNLTLNARDAMPNGGTLNICAVPVGDDPGGPRAVRLTVRDSGGGIAPDVRPHLFEAFFTTKPAGQGTGLGLATVLSIVRSHGGQIEAWSEAGAGTAFQITLPVMAAATVESHSPVAPAGRGRSILLSEPQEQVRRLMTSTLRSWGYEVVALDTLAEALAAFFEAPARYSVLVLGDDSLELATWEGLTRIRTAGYHTPAILTTQVRDRGPEDSRDKIMRVLRRPFRMSELGATLCELLENQTEPGAGR